MNEKKKKKISILLWAIGAYKKALSLERKKSKVILCWDAYEPSGWKQLVKAEMERMQALERIEKPGHTYSRVDKMKGEAMEKEQQGRGRLREV